MKYVYRGPMPVSDGAGGVIRPGDRRDFPSEPDWGPWQPLAEASAEVPGQPAAAAVPPSGPVTVQLPAAVISQASPSGDPKGM